MSENRNVRSRMRAEFIGRISSTTLSALLTIILARLLDPNGYGLLFLAISIFSLLGIASKLGIGRSAGRYIAEYKEKSKDQINHIIKASLLYNIISISVISVFTYALYNILINIIGEPGLEPFLLLGILFIVFSTLQTYVRRVLQGFEAIELTAIIQFIDKATKLVFAIVLVLSGLGALGAFGGYVMGYAFATVVGSGLLYAKFYRIYETADVMESGLARRIGEYMIPLTMTDTAHTIDNEIDTILIGAFLTPIAVGYYTVGKQIIKFIEVPASSIGFTLSPTLGAQKANGNIKKASYLYRTTLVHSLLLYIPAAVGLFLVAEPVIELVFGSDYLGAVPVLQVFAAYSVIQSVAKITSDGLDYLGRARERAIAKGATSVLNIILNVILITTIGVVGAAIATLISYSLYTLVSVYIIHIEVDIRPIDLLTRIGTIVVVSIIMSIPVSIVLRTIDGVIGLIAAIMVGVAIWLLLSLLAGLLSINQMRAAIT